ncbi:MAG TPA: nuclear transport factor 2 family protein [Acidimicrobiia bacterium]|jgi:ketosteroid isomerase-like protein
MTSDDIQAWLDRYVEAWHTYDRDAIVALFTEDASHRYHPYDEPIFGAQAIADDWLANQDEPGSWEAEYHPHLVTDDRVITTGKTSYSNGNVYWNLWELEFDDSGRCRRFIEWFVLEPKD